VTTPAIYHLDFETFSPENLKDVGAFKYAAHPEAEILVMAIAKNDDEPLVWSTLQKNDAAVELLQEAIRTGAEIWAHNAQFEFAISKHLFAKTFGMQPPALTQWRCTAALCRLAAIPSSLAQAGEFLGIDMPKDKAGAKLIAQFCLAGRIHPAEAPLDFHEFVEYCRRDVEAERQIYKALHWLTQQPHPNPAHFQADLRMNDRGIPLNIDALRHAEKLISDYTEKLIPIFRSQVAHPTKVIVLPVTKQRKAPKRVIIPFGFDPSQGEMMRAWLKARGFTGADLQADTVSAWLTQPLVDQLTPEAVTALSTYALIGSAAVKKIPAMLQMAEQDGKVRGALLIYGAERTHRWTGRGIQPQNFARPTIEFSDLAYACLCAGATLEELEALFGDLFPIMVSIIRNFIQPPGGQMVLQADYSAIEARVAP
jgi:DNA polymerase